MSGGKLPVTGAERYCVVLSTLQAGVPVASTFALESRQ